MKRLFITTSIVAIGAMSTGLAHAQEAPALTSSDYTQINTAVTTTAHAVGLHMGDFQIHARAAKTNVMYRGDGASLMTTTIQERD